MKKILLSLMVSLISMGAFAEVYHWKDFSEFKREYFARMDYFVPEVAKEIPEFERKLLKISEQILSKSDAEKKKEDADFLAYTALFILNTKGGFFAGTITLDDLDDSQKFTSSNILQDIHLARHKYVVRLLEESNRINPNHRLVPYWLQGSQFSLELLENREPTEEQVQQFVKQAKDNAFGFFNTYITLKEANMNDHVNYKNETLEKALDESAQKMLFLQLPRGEGLTKAQKKENAEFVPYMVIGSLTALAEYFAVRSAEVAETNKKLATKFNLKAQMALVYTRVPLITGFKMYKWDRLKEKRELQKIVNQFASKKHGDHEKAKMSKLSTLKIISCASCHTQPVEKANEE